MASALLLAAALVGFVPDVDGSRIDLYTEAGMCVGAARRAEWVPRQGARVGGCWLLRDGVVVVVFLDGDVAVVLVQAVKPAPES